MQSKILIIEDDHAITHLLDVALTLDYYNDRNVSMLPDF